MADFLHAYKTILSNEGGYSNRASDKGGETYAGISRRWNPDWSGWAIVDQHKPIKQGEKIPGEQMESLVRTFYKHTKWDRIQADRIGSQWVAEFTVDWLVTSDADAIIALQRAVGVHPDGKVGNNTLKAVNAADEAQLKETMLKARRVFYLDLLAKDPAQKANIKGWLNRVERFQNAL
jgi:lysozyme family protein